MKWSAACESERNAPGILRTPITMLTMAAAGSDLNDDSSAILTTTPKEESETNVAAFLKEGTKPDAAR